MTRCQTISILALLSLFHFALGAEKEARSLLSNGDFESSADGKPIDWKIGNGITWETDGQNHFLRLKVQEPGHMVMAFRSIVIPSDVKALQLSYKVRYEGIERGEKSWFDGRIILNFRDADKQLVDPSPSPPTFKGTSAQWKEQTRQFRVPADARTLELMFTLFNAKDGQLDFDDIELHPIDVSVIEVEEAEAAAKEAARIAALPKPNPQAPVVPPDQLPPELHVSGNQLLDASNHSVWLQGVAIPSLEWSGAGEHVLQSVRVALDDWKANCIRLPVRENFWFGHGPYQKDGGMLYRQTIDDAVNLCAARHAYLVLDLHDFRAPEQKHVEFWKDAATKYKNHPAVLFELFNEPHDITWDVWRNGGVVKDEKKAGDVAAENTQKLRSFTTVGMQALLDTIRAQGARNVVIAGGLDWSYDLSGILNGFALSDPNGNGVMYSAHVYPWKSDWQHKFLDAAAKYPLFLGEVGADTQKMSFVPADRQEDPSTWVPDMLGVIQKYHLNWTAWDFHPKSTPRVIVDWDYTPTPFWGAFVKRALAGEKFDVEKLR